jgi:glycosyltransferase involved in cell wall biosynthesis
MISFVERIKKVSVCIATFNGQQRIKRQLVSILEQIGENDEIIISDDNSTDETEYVIKEICDKRISFFVNKGKKGPVGNFQNALLMATGDYIFLADQDDVWLPNKLVVMTKLLEKYDLVLSDCIVVDDQLNTIFPSFFKVRGSRKGLAKNIVKNSYMGCCMAFRQTVISHVLPFPSRIHMHDWWIGLVIELKGKVFFCETPLILYVRHGNNASPTGERSYSFTHKLYNRLTIVGALLSRLVYGISNNSNV